MQACITRKIKTTHKKNSFRKVIKDLKVHHYIFCTNKKYTPPPPSPKAIEKMKIFFDLLILKSS